MAPVLVNVPVNVVSVLGKNSPCVADNIFISYPYPLIFVRFWAQALKHPIIKNRIRSHPFFMTIRFID